MHDSGLFPSQHDICRKVEEKLAKRQEFCRLSSLDGNRTSLRNFLTEWNSLNIKRLITLLQFTVNLDLSLQQEIQFLMHWMDRAASIIRIHMLRNSSSPYVNMSMKQSAISIRNDAMFRCHFVLFPLSGDRRRIHILVARRMWYFCWIIFVGYYQYDISIQRLILQTQSPMWGLMNLKIPSRSLWL